MPDEKPKLEGFMTVLEIAAKTGKDASTIRYAIRKGTLKATRVGKHAFLATAADVQAWLDNPDAHKRGRRKLGT